MTRAAALMLGVLGLSSVHAAPFADPTRPPGAVDLDAAGADAPAGPRLESVLIAPDRCIAVISGRQVRVGTRIAEGEVIRITETEVAIRAGERTEVLKLFPDIDKQPRKRRAQGSSR